MGGKTTDTQGLFQMGRDIHDWYAQQAGLFQNKADEFYRNAQPHLEKAMGINDGLMGLTNDQAVLGRQIFGSMPLYMENQANLANQQMGLAQRQGGFMDAQQAAMAKSLGYADQAMGQANDSRQQAQTAYGDSRALTNEYNSVYRPANAKLINDAMNFNTAAYREGLAQQAAADAGRAFSTTMNANAQQQRSMGVNPNSRRFQAMQNQNALALAAERSRITTDTRRRAEQEGVTRQINAVNSKGGAHLLDASGNMFNAGTNAMSSATGAMNAGANALGTGIQAGNSLLDVGNQAANKAYGAYNSLMSGALNAGEFGNQSAQLTSGLANNNLGLVNGLDQQYLGNWLQGLNINTQGLNALMGMYGQGYGLEAQNNANQNAFTNGLIGAIGNMFSFAPIKLP